MPKIKCWLVLILSLLDVKFTLYHLSRGAIEVNPLMLYLLSNGVVVFILGKLVITILALGVCYKYYHLVLTQLGLNVIIVVYTVLLIYHIRII